VILVLNKSTKWTSERLAEHVCHLKSGDIPHSALSSASRCVLDAIGAGIAGFQSPAAKVVRQFCKEFFSKGTASVWFSDKQLSTAGAAMANSAAVSVLDVDDGSRLACGHPGAVIIPASLALAQAAGASGRQFLSAVVIGYQVAVNIAASRDLSKLDTYSTGRWGAYGVAAAGAWLYGLNPSVLAHALAIVGNYSPMQSASGYGKVANNVKEGIPWSAMTGVASLRLAQEGLTGPLDIFDNPEYFNISIILHALSDPYVIEQTYFKPYSCCRWFHAGIEGLVDLMQQHHLLPSDVQSVQVYTFKEALTEKNEVVPQSLESAQYSYPFCLAVAAHGGAKALLPFDEKWIGRKDLLEWALRVQLVLDQELDALFPRQTAARLVVNTQQERLSRLIEYPLGDPANPLSLRDHQDKFFALSRRSLNDEEGHKLIKSVDDLMNDDLAGLILNLEKCRIKGC
jgi:2-methylcitrate dehydratase PrpD